jgi:hypothetical protein
MTEYYVELQDASGTYYGTVDRNDDVLYFDDLDEARMYAKDQLSEEYVVVRVIDAGSQRVVDFFKG